MRVPFEKHGEGVRAAGTVKRHSENEDGSIDIGIRHRELRKPKKGKAGAIEPYDYVPETNITVPRDAAHHFPVGQRVHVHVMPHHGKVKGKGAIKKVYAKSEESGEKY